MELIANERAVATLAALVRQGRLPHALGIEAPLGSGKKMFAALAAQSAVCSAEAALRPCGVCKNCTKAAAKIHPDIIYIRGSGKSGSFPIKEVRTIIPEAQLSANEAAVKVFIIEDAHNMSPVAQNVLLKVIEEPPAQVMFILTYSGRTALLPTILSRIVTIGLDTPTQSQCEQYLAAHSREKDGEKIRLTAELSGGNIGRAMEMLSSAKALEKAGHPKMLAQHLISGSSYAALALLAPYEKDRTAYATLLSDSALYLKKEAANVHRLGNTGLSSLQTVSVTGIIENASRCMGQNVGLGLISAYICASAGNIS